MSRVHSFAGVKQAVGVLLILCLALGGPVRAGTPVLLEPGPDPVASPQPPLSTTGPDRAFSDGVTYELIQYEPIPSGLVPRLVDLPSADGGPSPVYTTPANFRKKVVGWVFVEQLSDGSRLQRWLILHELILASLRDIEISPASYMGGTFTAPSSVDDFVERAEEIFDAAKLSSPDPPRDRTRYVKVHTASHTVLDHENDIPANNVVPDPSAPQPAGNGYWDGNPPVQLDGGAVGIYKKGTSSNALVGRMQETNSGYSGTESWFLADAFLAPTEAQPIIVASTNYCQFTGVGSTANLSEVISSNPVETRREWNMLRESAMYYSETFPSSNP